MKQKQPKKEVKRIMLGTNKTVIKVILVAIPNHSMGKINLNYRKILKNNKNLQKKKNLRMAQLLRTKKTIWMDGCYTTDKSR